MAVTINFAGMKELQTIPGIGETPDALINMTRDKISRKAIDSIDLTFNDEISSEGYGYFDSLAETVKKEPNMARSNTAQPDGTGYPAQWGGVASLFASAHGKRVQLGSHEPQQQIKCTSTELGSSIVGSMRFYRKASVHCHARQITRRNQW